jgi:hypothetical protein
MERYVYYSIGILAFFVFFLYIYLIYEKFVDIFNIRKKTSYEKYIVPYIDELLSVIDVEYPEDIYELRAMLKNRIKREIIESRIIYYIEMFTGTMRSNLIKLSEEIGLIHYEVKNLKDKDVFKTALALKNLGSLRSKTAIKPIIEISNKRVTDIRYHSLMALSKIGDADAFVEAIEGVSSGFILSERSLTEIIDSFEGDKPTLYERMIASRSIYLSTMFIKSAGNYMNTNLNDKIAVFIKDDNKDRRIAAIKAIGQSGDIRFLETLIKCLKDEEWEVRAVAAKALGRFGSKKPVPHLVKALSDREWWVRYNSALSIIKLPGGINVAEDVLSGSDRFAKDILISAIEGSGVMVNAEEYLESTGSEKGRLEELLKKYTVLGQS